MWCVVRSCESNWGDLKRCQRSSRHARRFVFASCSSPADHVGAETLHYLRAQLLLSTSSDDQIESIKSMCLSHTILHRSMSPPPTTRLRNDVHTKQQLCSLTDSSERVNMSVWAQILFCSQTVLSRQKPRPARKQNWSARATCSCTVQLCIAEHTLPQLAG